MTCPRCDTSPYDLCQECRLERDHEYFEQRAAEFAEAGNV